MKRKNNILRIASIFTAFALGVACLTSNLVNHPTKVEAEQHFTNYELYSYDGTYYEDKDIDFDSGFGMDGTLRTSLSNKNRPAQYYTYSGYSVGNNVSTVLQIADQDPDNSSSNMVYFYSRDSVAKTAANADATTIIWDREHVWPKTLSNGNWVSADDAYKHDAGVDILHIRPEYHSVNGSRGNKPFGDNGKEGTNTYEGMIYGYSEGKTYFEPIDSVKGDVARIIMYVWVTYTGYTGYNPIDILDVFESYDTLIKWHTMDQPDVLEGYRNDYVESSIQGNRNPFVDHPELAWKIFGTEVENQTILNNCVNTYPASGYVPVNPTSMELNETSLSMDVNETFTLTATLNPVGAVGSVLWSSNKTSVATVDENGVVTAKGAGSATITARVSSSIYATCNVTVIPTSGTVTSNIFEADLTSTMSVSAGFTISNNSVSKESGYYQDKGTADSAICSFTVKSTSPLFETQPSQIELTARLGAGSKRDQLNHNVEACFVDSSGNEISSSIRTVASGLQKDPQNITITLPYISNTYGVKIMHMKESGWNVRYYSFSLSATFTTSVGPEAYLSTATKINTIYGDWDSTEQNNNSSITFKTAGLANSTDITNVTIGDVTLNSAKGSNPNGNTPKYFDSGNEMRVYKGNTFTFTSSNSITRIEFTFTGGTATGLAAASGTLNGNVWTGEGTSITFSNSNTDNTQIKIKAISITTNVVTISVTDIVLRFGIKIPTASWDAIVNNADWTIQDYGVMMYKTNSSNLSSLPTVQSRYEASASNVAVGHRNNGLTPDIDGNGNYNFFVRVDIPEKTEFPQYFGYNTYFIVRPFVKINNQIYWLLDDDIQESVNSMAQPDHNTGTNLPEDVLSYLQTAQ